MSECVVCVNCMCVVCTCAFTCVYACGCNIKMWEYVLVCVHAVEFPRHSKY